MDRLGRIGEANLSKLRLLWRETSWPVTQLIIILFPVTGMEDPVLSRVLSQCIDPLERFSRFETIK